MNRKLFIMGLWVTLLGFFGCKPESKKIVSFSDFRKAPSQDVYVKFEERFGLLNVISVKSKTRLQSKITTIIKTDVVCQTNINEVLVILPRSKRIEKNLKTIRERQPYVDGFEKSLLNSDVTNIKLSGLVFEQDKTYPEYNEYIVLREVAK